MRILTLLLCVLACGPAFAFGADKPLADPREEARARAVQEDLRCLVCQNESIAESDAPLAADLRRIVRERIAAGDTNEQAEQYLVARYGQWVLLRPPFEPATWALWLGPFVLLIGAGGFLLWRRRRGEAVVAPIPLDEAERRRLGELLAEEERS